MHERHHNRRHLDVLMSGTMFILQLLAFHARTVALSSVAAVPVRPQFYRSDHDDERRLPASVEAGRPVGADRADALPARP
jgi:hypothetical protein